LLETARISSPTLALRYACYACRAKTLGGIPLSAEPESGRAGSFESGASGELAFPSRSNIGPVSACSRRRRLRQGSFVVTQVTPRAGSPDGSSDWPACASSRPPVRNDHHHRHDPLPNQRAQSKCIFCTQSDVQRCSDLTHLHHLRVLLRSSLRPVRARPSCPLQRLLSRPSYCLAGLSIRAQVGSSSDSGPRHLRAPRTLVRLPRGRVVVKHETELTLVVFFVSSCRPDYSF
jgi:hypothetical protein